LLVYLVCIVLAVLFLFPIVWAAISSIKPPAEASAVPPTFLPSRVDFGNYIKLNDYGRRAWTYVGNSVGTAMMTVIGATILSTLAGYESSLRAVTSSCAGATPTSSAF
jgi:multiple sugar transport system permease protein